MPVKLTLATSGGSNYPLNLSKSWNNNFNNSAVSKRVVESNTESSYTTSLYFADEDALATYRSDNADVISAVNARKTANSLTTSRTVETVDSIP
jgi:hypothetical protein